MFSVATKKGGMSNAFPDVCKTPAAPSPIPLPYPNIADCKDADSGSCAKKVKVGKKKVITGKTKIKKSKGDEAGTLKGVVSQKNRGEAKFLRKSTKTKAQGNGVVFQTCNAAQNGINANIPAGVLSTVSQSKVKVAM